MGKYTDALKNGTLLEVTEEDLKAPWRCIKNGEAFVCGLCGYKFKLGDKFRWLYTNHLKGYGSNPFVCVACNDGDVLEKWKRHVDEFNSDKFKHLRYTLY